MTEIRLHANRNLRPRTLANGEERGLERYFAFTHGCQPRWWCPELEERYGSTLGVYENVDGEPRDAILIQNERIVVLLEEGPTPIRYDEIDSFAPFEKEPLPTEIVVRMRNGKRYEVPIHQREGELVDFLRFMLAATAEWERRRNTDAL